MTDRLSVHSLDIPDRSIARAAADVTIRCLKRNGIDPRKAIINPLLRQACQEWARGEHTDEQFDRICQNMLIMNPSLAL